MTRYKSSKLLILCNSKSPKIYYLVQQFFMKDSRKCGGWVKWIFLGVVVWCVIARCQDDLFCSVERPKVLIKVILFKTGLTRGRRPQLHWICCDLLMGVKGSEKTVSDFKIKYKHTILKTWLQKIGMNEMATEHCMIFTLDAYQLQVSITKKRPSENFHAIYFRYPVGIGSENRTVCSALNVQSDVILHSNFSYFYCYTATSFLNIMKFWLMIVYFCKFF